MNLKYLLVRCFFMMIMALFCLTLSNQAVSAREKLHGGLLEVKTQDFRTGSSANQTGGTIVSVSLSEKGEGWTQWDVTYMSTGLRVNGILFMPSGAREKAETAGGLPGIVFNHGGVGGVPGPTIERCRELALLDYIVIAPSYRGEDGSEGEIEVAAGEVDDALNAAAVLRSLPEADPDSVAMMGTSHGGIITLLAIQRDHSFAAAVCAYGVTNTFTWYKYLVDNGFDVSDPLSVKVYGRGPDDKPEAFRKRAPALYAHLIETPVLLLYGEEDSIVPPAQAEEMAAAMDEAGKDYELHIFPGLGHGLLFYMDPGRHSDEELEGAAMAWNLALGFLEKHLAAQ